MPEFKKMSPAEIKAARERIQGLMGGKKAHAKEEPGKLPPRNVEEIRKEMLACNAMLTHAINANDEAVRKQMVERMMALRNELHDKSHLKR